MTAAEKRLAARSMYIGGMDMDQIRHALNLKSVRSVQNYKSEDQKSGLDWDALRIQKVIEHTGEDGQNLYANFARYMHESIREIRGDENMSTQQKVDAIAKLGDSFAKMRGIAHAEDPKAYTLGIVKHTVKTLLGGLSKAGIELHVMEQIVETVHAMDQELANVTI